MPVTNCVKILSCCGRTHCCPDTVLPDDLDATVTSSCVPLNGVVHLHKTSNDPPTWVGRVAISGCGGCTILEVDLSCLSSVTGTGTGLAYHWTIGFTVFRSDGVTPCVISSPDGSATLTETCGPPLHVTYTASDLTLTDPITPLTCCAGFTITIDVLGP